MHRCSSLWASTTPSVHQKYQHLWISQDLAGLSVTPCSGPIVHSLPSRRITSLQNTSHLVHWTQMYMTGKYKMVFTQTLDLCSFCHAYLWGMGNPAQHVHVHVDTEYINCGWVLMYYFLCCTCHLVAVDAQMQVSLRWLHGSLDRSWR